MAASLSMLPHLRRLIDPSALDLGGDAALLDRFVRHGDQTAFAVLVARHGLMVLRVCRRVLGDAHAAEDACQAAFLVLARKAASIRHAETLAAWLHGVAYRLALKARAVEVRRRQAEIRSLQIAPAPSPVDPLAEVSGRELLAILDAELQSLPERYRLPLILCCLEGRSQPEAARLLGWTPGSVKGRLERGRAKLHQRLLRRGLTLPAALLALEAAQGAATARMPAALTASIVRAIGGGVSVGVAALAEGGITGVVGMKAKIAFFLVLALGVAAGGASMVASPGRQPSDASPNPGADAPRSPKDAPRVRTDHYGDPLPPGAIARLGTIRLRSGDVVHFVACSPDGQSVLSLASEEGGGMRVCVWRMSTGELLRQLESPSRILRAVTLFVSDGKTLVVAGFSRQGGAYRVLLWNIASGKKMGELTETGPLFAVAFAPDGRTFATAGEDETLRLWDRDSRTELRRFEGAKSKWHRLAFSADGKTLVSLGEDSTVQYWDAANGKATRSLRLGPGSERVFALSPDGKMLAARDNDDKIVRLWDLTAGKETHQLRSDTRIDAVAFSLNGKLLATGDGHVEGKVLTTSPIRLWDVDTGRELRRLPGHLFGVDALAFSADGKRLISGSYGLLRVWDVATGKDVLPFAEHESYVSTIAFSPNGRLVATGSVDGSIRLWEPASGKPIRRLPDGHRQRVWQVAFAADGQTLLSYGQDGSVRFWDVESGRETRKFIVRVNQRNSKFAVSPDGRTLAVWGHDAPIRLLDAAIGQERRRLTGVPRYPGMLRFSPDGRQLASISATQPGGTSLLQVWDTATGEKTREWTRTYPGPIAFSPDGRSLLGIDSPLDPPEMTRRPIHRWDIATGADRPFVPPQYARVFALTFSPDGRMLAWGDAESAVTLWDVAAGQIRHRLKGQHSSIESLAFSPDGKMLASGSGDTTVLLWDVTGRSAVGQSGPISAERLRALWDDLASKDAGKAFDAIGLLTASPEQAVPLLKDKLRPAPAPADRQQVARLIADLDSEEFAVRQKAREKLRRLDERAEPELQEALKGKLSLEARKRIEELLEGVRALAASPEKLRVFRAVEVLEHIGTAEAQAVLKTLANGAAEARLTREAKASLQRLFKRQAAP